MVSTFTVLDFSLALISVVIETQHLKTWKNHNNLPPRWMQSTRETLASWHILHPSLASAPRDRAPMVGILPATKSHNSTTTSCPLALSVGPRASCQMKTARARAPTRNSQGQWGKTAQIGPLPSDCRLPHPIHLRLGEQNLANHNPQWHKSLSNYPKATIQTPKMLCCDAKVLQIVEAKRSWFLNNTT